MKNDGKRNDIPVIGVMNAWFRGQYQYELISGIEYEAKKTGARIVYLAGRYLDSPEAYDGYQNIIYDIVPHHRFDGLIITGVLANYCTDVRMDDFVKQYSDIPLITIDYKVKGIPAILVQNELGFKKLILHLIIKHGCRKIAFIKGAGGNLDSHERFEIYKNTLVSNNCPVDEKLMVEGDFSYLSGRKAVKTLLHERHLKPGMDFDAIAASNDLMALGAIDELRAHGIDVPGDVAVTGFDDTLDARDSPHLLTTVRQPVFSMGREAVKSLLDYSSDKDDIYFDTQPVIRNSCGCTTCREQGNEGVPIDCESPGEKAVSDFRERGNTSYYQRERISEYYLYQLVFVSDALKQVMTLGELESWMERGFSSLGIEECYLFLYRDPGDPSTSYMLAAGYTRKGKISESEKKVYSAETLFASFFQDSSHSFCFLPVLFRDEQSGFLLAEVNLSAWIAYETIRSQVSVSLKNMFLIEEIQSMNRRLAKANKKLSQSEKQKTRFFINIAHETKTPLTLIKNYLDKYLHSHEHDNDLIVIKSNIEILLENMVNFLDAEKLEMGKILYNHDQVVHLSDIMEKKAEIFREIAGKKNIRILPAIEERIFVRADPWAIDRILNNLLDNAVKYTQDNGDISMTLERKNRNVVLSVSDNGPGIAKDKISHIFKPYYQLSQHMTGSQGIGMGLYIVKKIVNELGASIDVESKEGKGTMFTITMRECEAINAIEEYETLHLSKPPGSTHIATTLKEEKIEKEKSTILIVDDNRDMLAFLQSVLKEDYNVCMAGDAQSALIKLEKMPRPEIIVSDIMMDRMDGHEFLHIISSDSEYSDIPFIFLTAKHTEQEKLRGLSGGAVDFIEKPFSAPALKKKIESIISLRKKQKKLEMKRMRKKIESLLSDTEQPGIPSKYERFEKICVKNKITGRERDVIALILKGLVNKEIAASLNLTQRTVEFHITNIYKKCGVGDRFELIALFKENG
jgi:signal transduction histidine kinase/DNA-binding LacI/PurR family transcriptional regulator/DNA-binding NarL/FixJ family response regulator